MKDLIMNLCKAKEKNLHRQILANDDMFGFVEMQRTAIELSNEELIDMVCTSWKFFCETYENNEHEKIVNFHIRNYEIFEKELLRRLEGKR